MYSAVPMGRQGGWSRSAATCAARAPAAAPGRGAACDGTRLLAAAPRRDALPTAVRPGERGHRHRRGRPERCSRPIRRWEVLGVEPRRLVGRTFPVGLPDRAQRELGALLDRVHASGRSGGGRAARHHAAPARTPGGGEPLPPGRPAAASRAPAHPGQARCRGGDGSAGAVADRRARPTASSSPTPTAHRDGECGLRGPAQLASEDQLRGESIDRWLGRPGVDLNVMLATLRQQGRCACSRRRCTGSTARRRGRDLRRRGARRRSAVPRLHGAPRRPPAGRRSGGGQERAALGRAAHPARRPHAAEGPGARVDRPDRAAVHRGRAAAHAGQPASAAEMLGPRARACTSKLRRYGISDARADAD